VGEIVGVLAAVLNTTIGGLTVGVTRYVISATDPIALGALRFGIGGLLLLPFALVQLDRWPRRRDLPGTLALGLLYFALYPVLFNAGLAFTTAVRGALALSTAPLLTMLAGAILGVERLTLRKTLGVSIATSGVAIALLVGSTMAPAGEWRGDMLMVGAALCTALYNVWSRPFIDRSGTVTYTVICMMVGAAVLTVISWAQGSGDAIAAFGFKQWTAVGFLGVLGGALAFYLWTFALERTTPTRVAIAITWNPIAAGIFGVVALDEQITWNLVLGLLMVLTGIYFAASGMAARAANG
jgi:drug/metabolite transporter (DMT)-like permease